MRDRRHGERSAGRRGRIRTDQLSYDTTHERDRRPPSPCRCSSAGISCAARGLRVGLNAGTAAARIERQWPLQPRNSRRRRAAACSWPPSALLGASARSRATGLPATDRAPINLEAALVGLRLPEQHAAVQAASRSRRATLDVAAQQASATGLDFENSAVAAAGRRAASRCRTASSHVGRGAASTFKDNAIARARRSGRRRRSFEQRLKETGQVARGRAGSIEYDVRKRPRCSLTGDAWLERRQQRDPRAARWSTTSAASACRRNPGANEPGGVQITINPKADAGRARCTPQPPDGRR
ncbi:MAG: hypothetical protein MZW92_04000 [Comamonadaceae bacterium]|nr:hypothetical protein [Comamonadaceae bacterium]